MVIFYNNCFFLSNVFYKCAYFENLSTGLAKQRTCPFSKFQKYVNNNFEFLYNKPEKIFTLFKTLAISAPKLKTISIFLKRNDLFSLPARVFFIFVASPRKKKNECVLMKKNVLFICRKFS